MIRVNILCEGPTEERFVSKVLAPHLFSMGIVATPRSIGGANNYAKVRQQIILWLRQEPSTWLTTLVDLYGMNRRFPGYASAQAYQPRSKALWIEAQLKIDIEGEGVEQAQRFFPHVQLHEFEALLFADPAVLEDWLRLYAPLAPNSLANIRTAFETPEHINDSPHTAPSKRIKGLVENYDKVTDGWLISQEIGLDKIRAECPHFNAWLAQIEALVALEEA